MADCLLVLCSPAKAQRTGLSPKLKYEACLCYMSLRVENPYPRPYLGHQHKLDIRPTVPVELKSIKLKP